jgi:predicted Zn-dependent peptidase
LSPTALLPIFSTRLPSGLRLVVEPLGHVRSVALGVWVTAGSRHEPHQASGVSHFLEHLVFKGTSHRSAKAIARTIEAIGGQLDAFTCKEQACYYAKVLDEHLSVALELLSDILTDPLIAPEDIERERRVIIEEINLVEDTPSDGIFDLFYATIFDGHPLGRPILGTPKSITNLSRDDILGWRASNLCTDNILVAVSGSCTPGKVIKAVSEAFSLPSNTNALPQSPPRPPGRRLIVKEKASEQVNLCMGFPSVHDSSPRRYAAALLSNILGGGVASRLFQRIREEEGLAYAIHTFMDTYSDSGAMGIYAGVGPEAVRKVLYLIGEELDSIMQRGVEPEELSTAKEQFKGQINLALEDTSNRMSRLARQTITFGRHFSLEESIEQTEAVSLDDVLKLATDIFSPRNQCLALIGPVRHETLEDFWFTD